MINLDFLKQQRKLNRYSCRQIAQVLGFNSTTAYWNIERGKTSLKCEQLEILSKLFSQPIEKFFTGSVSAGVTIQNFLTYKGGV